MPASPSGPGPSDAGGRSRSSSSARRRRRRGGGSGGRTSSGASGQQAVRRSGSPNRQPQRRGQGQAARSRQASPAELAPASAPATVTHGVVVLDRVVDDPTAAVAGNRRRAAMVAALPAAVLVVLGVVLGSAAGELVLGVIVGAAVGAAAAFGLWRGAPSLVLRALDARAVDEDDVPGPATQVEGLCASMGLGAPGLYVVDDPLPNALAVGRGPGHAALVLTTGLLGRLDPVQLEGVLAHELAHVKRNDVAPATVGAALLLVCVIPGGSGIVHRVAGRGREFASDRQAVRVTRYPPGLSQALVLLSEPLPGGPGTTATRRVGQVTRWLWTAVLPDPSGRRPDGEEAIGELDVPSVRVAALDEW